uniref:Peptidase M50 domain-containing protein n=1 Tax=Ananas comosus var. bracteatus TaxID=296719 RepID=A0A6V7QD95_ANACO|nr:unnamed protein product [Ananas comosus var. bracteatus]
MLLNLLIHPYPSSPPTPPSSLFPQTLTLKILTLLPLAPHYRAQSVAEAASVLAAIVLVHEWGHFAAAALRGIRVSQFAVGFGPVLARFVSRGGDGVEFSVRAFPLGGYVAFPDPDDPDLPFPPDDPDLLRNRPLPDRLLVVSAGVAANALFAFLLVLAQSLLLGLPSRLPSRASSSPTPSSPVPLTVSRGAQTLRLVVVPDPAPDGSGRIGVQLSPYFRLTRLRPASLPDALALSWAEFAQLSLSVLDGLKNTFLNLSESADKVSGPVAIIAVGAEVARSSSDGLFQFAAVINLNLAVINLLPLPALDGGSLALLLVEAARGGRKLPREVEQRIMSSGVLVVLALGMFLIVRDTLNLDFIKEML